jgi:hypothetical protein
MGKSYKGNGQPTEAHIRVNLSLLNSPAYIALDHCARALYVDLRARVRSTNNGDISAPLSELRHRGWCSAVTLAKALRQLEAVGLLAKTRKTVGVARGSKMCNLYRFTDLETLEVSKKSIAGCKATHDYKKFTDLGTARQATALASKPTPLAAPRKRSEATAKNTSLQKMHRDATVIAPMG